MADLSSAPLRNVCQRVQKKLIGSKTLCVQQHKSVSILESGITPSINIFFIVCNGNVPFASWHMNSTVFIGSKIRRKGTTQNYMHQIRRSPAWNCHNFSECISINPFIRYELILFKFKFMSIPCTKLFDASENCVRCILLRLRLMHYDRPFSMPVSAYCRRRRRYCCCKVTLIDLLRFWSTLDCLNGLAFSIDRTKSISFSRGESNRGVKDGEEAERGARERNESKFTA